MYSFILQGMSSKVAELEEELAKATSGLEQEKATTLAQTEEIEALKKVCSIICSETCITDFLLHGIVALPIIFTVSWQWHHQV